MGKILSKVVIENNLKAIGFILNYYYKNEKSKLYVNITCVNGHTYDIRYDLIMNKKTCKYCGKNCFTYEYVKSYIENQNQTLLSDTYKNAKSKLKIQCEFGHIYYPTFYNFKNKMSRCPKCKGVSKFSYEEVKAYIEKFNYKLISKEYLNNKFLIKVMCNKGHEYSVTFDNFKNKNKRCPVCNGGVSLTYEYVKEYIDEVGYSLISKEYINAKTKLQLMCDKGHYFESTFDNFKSNGSRCPKCNRSIGEERVSYYLSKHTIKYAEQYRFDECKFKYTLPFDFYLPDYNILIEYDGIQHFEIIEYFGGLDGFIETKIRDTIKNDYCKKNNIQLLRIPYWEFDRIEEILKEKLKLNQN